MSAKADAENFIAVYPQGVGNPTVWNNGLTPVSDNGADDVGFIRALVNKLEHDLRVDAKRIYCCGISSGAVMTYLLGAEMSHRFAAIGIVSGTVGFKQPDGSVKEDPTPAQPVPVIAFHGKKGSDHPLQRWRRDGGYALGRRFHSLLGQRRRLRQSRSSSTTAHAPATSARRSPSRLSPPSLCRRAMPCSCRKRRGYGKSDGQTYDEEVQGDRGDRMMKRFHEEASDVLAGLDYLKNGEAAANSNRFNPRPPTELIDFRRVAIMSWSHGGVASLLAASERHEFVALVDQAGGALTWNSSPTLQRELPAAAAKIKVPALCMDAENDATTNAAKEVGKAIKSSGEWEQTIIYPPFTPTSNPSNIAPGHLIFAQGVLIWQNDLLSFLKPRLENNRRFEKPSPRTPVKRVQP